MNFKEYCNYLNSTLEKINQPEIENFIQLMTRAYNEERMVFVIGNGGSAANASHFAQDLARSIKFDLNQTKRIKALSLTDNFAFVTSLSNDHGYDIIFEQQLRNYAKPGDMLIAISGSGNSPNIIKAVEWANNNGMVTIGFTGFSGGKLKSLAKHSVHTPLDDMCTTESIHSIIMHYIVLQLQQAV